MKLLVAFVLLFVSAGSFAQKGYQKVTGPVRTKQGVELKEGDILRFGEGTGANRSFRSAFVSFNRFGTEAGQLDMGYQYLNTTVREFYEVGTGNDRRLVALVRPAGGINLTLKAVDVENAIKSKEVISLNGTSLYKLSRKETSKR